MAKLFNNAIKLTNGFSLAATLPLDDRTVVVDKASLSELINQSMGYPGMTSSVVHNGTDTLAETDIGLYEYLVFLNENSDIGQVTGWHRILSDIDLNNINQDINDVFMQSTKWFIGDKVSDESLIYINASNPIKVGDLYLNIYSGNVYELIDSNTGTWQYKCCIRGVKGTTWYNGLDLEGVNLDEEYTINNTTQYNIGDYYLNNLTGNYYRCIKEGVGSDAKWQYQSKIRGSKWWFGEDINKINCGNITLNESELFVGDKYLNTINSDVFNYNSEGKWEYIGSLRGNDYNSIYGIAVGEEFSDDGSGLCTKYSLDISDQDPDYSLDNVNIIYVKFEEPNALNATLNINGTGDLILTFRGGELRERGINDSDIFIILNINDRYDIINASNQELYGVKLINDPDKSPFEVDSNNKVDNLNADMVDGYHASIENEENKVVARDGAGTINITHSHKKSTDFDEKVYIVYNSETESLNFVFSE